MAQIPVLPHIVGEKLLRDFLLRLAAGKAAARTETGLQPGSCCGMKDRQSS